LWTYTMIWYVCICLTHGTGPERNHHDRHLDHKLQGKITWMSIFGAIMLTVTIKSLVVSSHFSKGISETENVLNLTL
jgi:hypothetical protein